MAVTKFNANYFSKYAYTGVDFKKKFTMYWWSCRFYANLIQRLIKSGKVLDIGCGLGHVLGRLPEQYLTYGVDINPSATEKAHQDFKHTKFYTLDAKNLDKIGEDNFDLVLMRYLVEHVKRPDTIISKAATMVKLGGYLIVATPNPDNVMARHLGKKWVGFKDPTHISIKPVDYWVSLIERNGFRIQKVVSDGFWAPPYISLIPTPIQKLLFGSLGGVQALTGLLISPVNLGEQVIIIAQKLSK